MTFGSIAFLDIGGLLIEAIFRDQDHDSFWIKIDYFLKVRCILKDISGLFDPVGNFPTSRAERTF